MPDLKILKIYAIVSLHFVIYAIYLFKVADGGCGSVVKNVGPANGRLSVRIPAATEVSRKDR